MATQQIDAWLELLRLRLPDGDARGEATLDALAAELGRLRAWVADLQRGMTVNCVYCGHRYGPADQVPVSMAEALKRHVVACPEHPMSHLAAAYRATRLRLVLLAATGVSPTHRQLEDEVRAIDRELVEAGAAETP